MIQFKPITKNNFKECFNIDTGINEKYLPPIVYQIALSYIYPTKIPLAIYDDDELIGFVSYEKDTEPRIAYDILVFVISKKKQGKGLGTKALKSFINYLSKFEDCKIITLNYNADNKIVEKLYMKVGFKRTGLINKRNNEVVLELII